MPHRCDVTHRVLPPLASAARPPFSRQQPEWKDARGTGTLACTRPPCPLVSRLLIHPAKQPPDIPSGVVCRPIQR
ncbi:hypothetical protein HYPSUDRAFT_72629 [Hypholoma sublateritium FD-334 SS-4]|uniref:Uncharacterized protein n=1 Tax=Hypholoma sublateritium (strain FD-334 SS-4) TaxID=945553 RepID=A0A0D2LU25_HYPSF|nr:hypothetical protein HYPSUDRAFT_72629 [Hypholoma sublateritium FD-334 SS-4]